jgi:DNA-binding MarR family transcriptional regulator
MMASDVLMNRLGYLLKHANIRLTEAVAAALTPFGIDGRELAVLSVLAADYPLSQLEAAGRLGVDRTSMVALLDVLEDKGLVARRKSPHDRRKNIVELTPEGQDRMRQAERARDEVERRLLASLDDTGTQALIRGLQVLVAGPDLAGR